MPAFRQNGASRSIYLLADPKALRALIESEIEATNARFNTQGLSYEDYLRAIGKSDEEYRADLRPDVEARLRRAVVLQDIAKAESIEVTDEDVDAEIERVVGDAPNPERRRRLFSSEYFRTQLQNELYDRKLTEHLIEIATEGRGAISGPGADILAAGPEPPPPPRASASVNGEADEAASTPEVIDAEAIVLDGEAATEEVSEVAAAEIVDTHATTTAEEEAGEGVQSSDSEGEPPVAAVEDEPAVASADN
jgi:trigger factor